MKVSEIWYDPSSVAGEFFSKNRGGIPPGVYVPGVEGVDWGFLWKDYSKVSREKIESVQRLAAVAIVLGIVSALCNGAILLILYLTGHM